jgi:NADH-quinone oxidoreductase subunit L
LAAFLTAFYTMRQITLTFLGKPRTQESEHASESVPWMTIPLIVLAVFAIGAGWVGIPEHFPGIGGILPNWMHEFVGSMLGHPEALAFNVWPLLTSLVVALGGLLLGWLVYKDIPAGAEDPLKKPLGPLYAIFQNKYNIDEIYDVAFIRPSKWLAEKFTYLFLDRTVIDGILHLVARVTFALGSIIRNYFDEPVINGSGDLAASISQWFGGQLRKLQTGKVQQYMLMAATLVVIGLFCFFLVLFQ